MQFEGGYRYPGNAICALASVLSLLAAGLVWKLKPLPSSQAVALALMMEGTVLWASSFTPKGLTPPPTGTRAKIAWFFRQQGGTALSFNQPMFYLGILCILVACIMSALAS